MFVTMNHKGLLWDDGYCSFRPFSKDTQITAEPAHFTTTCFRSVDAYDADFDAIIIAEGVAERIILRKDGTQQYQFKHDTRGWLDSTAPDGNELLETAEKYGTADYGEEIGLACKCYRGCDYCAKPERNEVSPTIA